MAHAGLLSIEKGAILSCLSLDMVEVEGFFMEDE